MNKTTKFEFTHLYLPVAVISAIFIILFRGQNKLQVDTLVASAFIYMGIVLAHHQKDKSLTIEVLLEYILIAALSLLILQQFIY